VKVQAPATLGVLLAAALAGCLATPALPDAPSPSPNASTSWTATNSSADVRISGVVADLAEALVANVSAHNEGGHTYGYGQSYCVSPYGAWVAALSGPPGRDLDYRRPGTALGCPGRASTMPPGSYVNWTSGADAYPDCNTQYVCDNSWDRYLSDANGGPREPAPAGNYTWRFTFTYSDSPEGTATPSTEGRHQLVMDLHVRIP